jgi:hypothetical protein
LELLAGGKYSRRFRFEILWPCILVPLSVAGLNVQLVLFCICKLDVPWYFI